MNSAQATTEAETRPRVLIVEDNPSDAELMCHELARGGLDCVIHRVETESGFGEALEEFRPSIILADHTLPRFSGMRAFRIVEDLGLDTPVILVSGAVTEAVALQCLQAGVTDYLLKDNLLRLGSAVKNALESARIRRARRKLEDERRSLGMRLAALADSTGDAMIVSDGGGRIRFWNRAATSIFGFSAEEMIGEPLRTIVPERLWARPEAGMKAAASGKPLATRHTGVTGLHKSGVEVPIELTLCSWEEDGETSFSAVAQDITVARESKRERALEAQLLQAQLLQAQKMEAVAQLTRSIAHDFNNVFATIITSAQVLAMALPPELTEEAADVRAIERAARRGSDLIKKLRALSRNEPLDLEAADP